MWPTWGPSGAYMTQVSPMLAPWALLCGNILNFLSLLKLWVIPLIFLRNMWSLIMWWDPWLELLLERCQRNALRRSILRWSFQRGWNAHDGVKELRDNIRMKQKKGQELCLWSVMVSGVVVPISSIEGPCTRFRATEDTNARYHIEPRQICRNFVDGIFIFVEENLSIFSPISRRVIHTNPIHHKPTLVQIMSWHQTSQRCIYASLGLNGSQMASWYLNVLFTFVFTCNVFRSFFGLNVLIPIFVAIIVVY